MRHNLIVSAIDSILTVKRHWQADDGSFGSFATEAIQQRVRAGPIMIQKRK
jgi:hypothetical protein